MRTAARSSSARTNHTLSICKPRSDLLRAVMPAEGTNKRSKVNWSVVPAVSILTVRSPHGDQGIAVPIVLYQRAISAPGSHRVLCYTFPRSSFSMILKDCGFDIAQRLQIRVFAPGGSPDLRRSRYKCPQACLMQRWSTMPTPFGTACIPNCCARNDNGTTVLSQSLDY